MSDFEELDKIIKSLPSTRSSLFKVKLSPLYEEEKKLPIQEDWDELEMTIKAVLGSKKIPLKDLYKLNEGSLIEFPEEESEKIALIVNEKEIARGEMVVLNGHFGVKITEIIDQ